MLKIGSYISSANMYLCNPHTNAIAAAWKAGRIIKYERAAASVVGGPTGGYLAGFISIGRARSQIQCNISSVRIEPFPLLNGPFS